MLSGVRRLQIRLALSPTMTRAVMRLPRGSRLRRGLLRSSGVALGNALNRRDFSAQERLAADVEFHPREDFPRPDVRRGGGEITAYFQELFELFPDYRVELVGVEDPGDEKLVFRWRGTGTGAVSGAQSEAFIRQTIEFRRGHITRIKETVDPPG